LNAYVSVVPFITFEQFVLPLGKMGRVYFPFASSDANRYSD